MIELSVEDCWGDDSTWPQVSGHVDRREFKRALRRLARIEGWDLDGIDDVTVQHAYAIQDQFEDDGYRWWQLSPTNPHGEATPITIANLDGDEITSQVAEIPGAPCPDCGYRQELGDDQKHDRCARCVHAWTDWRAYYNGAAGHQLRTCSRCGMFEQRDGLADRRMAL